jgi:dTMP kinase
MIVPKGLFITFDGPNGVGKSFLLGKVRDQLTRMGFDVCQTKEPTSTPIGMLVRNAEEDYAGQVLACLVAADRYFHIEHEVLPALSGGKLVLCDRYVESSLVLQRLDGVDIDFIWALNEKIPIPSLSVVLTARPEVLIKRLAQRAQLSRFERSNLSALEVLYYQEAAHFLLSHGYNITSLENNDTSSIEQSIEDVIHKIRTLIQ